MPLISANVLDHDADIIVMITLGLQNAIRISTDSDPKIFISDGQSGIGFDLRDGSPRCQGMEALMGEVMSRSTFFTSNPAQSKILAEEYIITISPTQQWGSCHFTSDSGLASPVSFTENLHLNQGLWLEMYREDGNEQFSINYITVEIHEN